MKPKFYWCFVGNGWVAGGCWDDITSDDWDHSRKFPAFSTTKNQTIFDPRWKSPGVRRELLFHRLPLLRLSPREPRVPLVY